MKPERFVNAECDSLHRRNMCIHSNVMEESDRDAVDSLCRSVKKSRQNWHGSPEFLTFCFSSQRYDGLLGQEPSGGGAVCTG
jgi:hypothetical protein